MVEVIQNNLSSLVRMPPKNSEAYRLLMEQQEEEKAEPISPVLVQHEEEEKVEPVSPTTATFREAEDEKPVAISAAAAQAQSMEEEKKAPEPKPQAEKVDGQCYICFTPMVEPCTMECGHSFCMNCLRDFWKYKRECPMCRAVPSQKFQINCDKKLQLKIKKAEP